VMRRTSVGPLGLPKYRRRPYSSHVAIRFAGLPPALSKAPTTYRMPL
jgi:hypothetical protein